MRNAVIIAWRSPGNQKGGCCASPLWPAAILWQVGHEALPVLNLHDVGLRDPLVDLGGERFTPLLLAFGIGRFDGVFALINGNDMPAEGCLYRLAEFAGLE